MRSSESNHVTLVHYLDDTDRGTLMACGKCASEFYERELVKGKDESDYCPKCGVELFFRPWWTW